MGSNRGPLLCAAAAVAATLSLLVVIPHAEGSSIGKPAYGVIQNNGVAVASRNILNIITGGCVDNAPATDCTFSGGGGGAGAPNASAAFVAQTSVSIADNLGTTSKLVQCRDASDVVLEPNTVTITNANTTTVTFAVAQTGACVVNGSGGNGRAVTTKVATFTATSSDWVLLCNAVGGAITANLPAAATAGAGREYVVKKIDATANGCTLTPAGADTIDGAATLPNTTQWQSFTVVSDGVAGWFVI